MGVRRFAWPLCFLASLILPFTRVAAAVLAKPFTAQELAATIEDVLES
jgi:hypothetical protein